MKSAVFASLATLIVMLLLIFGLYLTAKPPKEQPVVIQYIQKEDDYEKLCRERSEWAHKALTEVYGIGEPRASEIAPMIAYASVIEDVPVEILVSIIKVESEFDQKAKSKSGAIGYAQVKPSSWKNQIPYNINNPQGNILAGAYVLKRYYLETGSWDNAIRAYNVGITNFNNGREKSAAERYHKKVYAEVRTVLASIPTLSGGMP